MAIVEKENFFDFCGRNFIRVTDIMNRVCVYVCAKLFYYLSMSCEFLSFVVAIRILVKASQQHKYKLERRREKKYI